MISSATGELSGFLVTEHYLTDSYNVGRDYLVGNLTQVQFDPRSVTNTSTFSGSSSYANYTYQTEAKYVPGLLKNSSGESDIPFGWT
jgi:hypothetical protein